MTVACTGIQLGGNKYRATRTDEKEKSVAAMNNPGLNVNADEEQTLRCTKSV